jgi:Holliday junction DNA helicase RuvB
VEEVYEPYLMRLGFIERTLKGRVVTDAAYKHLNLYRLGKDKQTKLLE